MAEDGKALVPIIIDDEASEATAWVAEELAYYLGKITGASFQITGDKSLDGILLGTLKEFPMAHAPQIAAALKYQGKFDGNEALVIRTERKRLLLLGATDRGASHAAFRFLEEIGCRWFFPARQWEVVPTAPTLRVNVNLNDRPAVLSRQIWHEWGLFDHDQAKEDFEAWKRHNRMASSLRLNIIPAWQEILAQNAAAVFANPQYLAEVEGRRREPQLCVSNQEVQRMVAAYAVKFFKRFSRADMVSLEPSEGGGHCECAPCARIGSISDRVFLLANVAAEAVAAKYPGKMVGLYARHQHSQPPSFKLERNVYVHLVAGSVRGRYSFDELLESWPKVCRNMAFSDHFSLYRQNLDMLPGGRGANIAYLRRQIPRYASLNARSIDAESGNNWGPFGRGYYIANRLMWNPNADVDGLLEDFYEKAFGPAATVMQRYYERFDPGNDPLISEHLLAMGFRDIDMASKMVIDRPDVLARLDHLKIYLRYMHLRWVLQRTKDEEAQKELTEQILTHVYRTRYTYMNHWEAMRKVWTSDAATAFVEPTWDWRNRSSPPWAFKEPPAAD